MKTARRIARRFLDRTRRLGEAGMTTAEYSVGTLASVAFAGLLLAIVRSGPVYEAAVAAIPVGRIGKAEDIVGMTVFLAADASRYVNGTVIPLDGGMSL